MLRFLVVVLLALPATLAAQKRAMTFADFSAVRVVGDPQVSPDGRLVLYSVRTTDVSANSRRSATYIIPADGGTPRMWPDDTTFVTEARWSPDGRRVAYVSRGLLWVSNVDGTMRLTVATHPGGVTGAKWSPTGDRLLYTARVYPACRTTQCNADSIRARATAPSQVRIADQLLYRHWSSYDDGTRSHLFVVRSNGGEPRDLVQGATFEVPPAPFGGPEAYNWSPDGREVAFTAKEQTPDAAWTTDLNVYVVPADGGAYQAVTASNKGADQNPVYSPDGRYLTYASQARAGFESDRWRLMFLDRTNNTSRELLPGWDRNADHVVFLDGSSILIETLDEGRVKAFRTSLPVGFSNTSATAENPVLLVGQNNSTGFSAARTVGSDGTRTVAWIRDAIHLPPEVYVGKLTPSGMTGIRVLTHENDALVAQLDLQPAEEIRYRGAGGTEMHGFITRPPNFDPSQKYPVLLLIHGGPQGAWIDSWGSRWNFALFAAPGYGVITLNPRGSTGYGQKLTDEVSKDWGGKVYTDLMNGLNAALAQYKWMDSTRMGAAGGSFGGYMVNWIAGHTHRFKALATHAGVFNLEHMGGATEELWFVEWEFGGPWWNQAVLNNQYRRWSPHLFVDRIRTPTLVLHGELDYRVPFTEGVAMFTALQRQGVPSRFVMFPDEGHWILRPANAQVWWREMHGWFGKHLKPYSN